MYRLTRIPLCLKISLHQTLLRTERCNREFLEQDTQYFFFQRKTRIIHAEWTFWTQISPYTWQYNACSERVPGTRADKRITPLPPLQKKKNPPQQYLKKPTQRKVKIKGCLKKKKKKLNSSFIQFWILKDAWFGIMSRVRSEM